MRKLADVAEQYGAKALKITGATRIAIVGLREEDIDAVWNELGMLIDRIGFDTLRAAVA